MADLSQEQFERFMDEMRRLTGEMSKIVTIHGKEFDDAYPGVGKKAGGAAKQLKQKHDKAAKKVNDNLDKFGNSLSLLEGRSRDVGAAFSSLAKGLIGGAVVGQIIKYSSYLVDSYRDVASVGQTFSGSIVEMTQAAGQAGLPLKEFADIVRRNSTAMSAYKPAAFMKVAKDSRDALMMYGYTMEDANTMVGQYVETQRRLGVKSITENGRVVASIKQLGLNATALAGAFGTTREDVVKHTMDAMQDTQFMASMVGRSGAAAQEFSDRAMKAISVLAALPGEAGSLMSKSLAQTIGNGDALFTSATQDFVKSGLGGMLGAMQNFADTVNQGGDETHAGFQYIKEFRSQIEQNIDVLKIQSKAGNASATKMLQMYEDMRNVGSEDDYKSMKAQTEQTKDLTAAMLDFGNILQRLGGTVIAGIMKNFLGFDRSSGNFMKFLESDKFKKLEDAASRFGIALGGIFGQFATWLTTGNHATELAKDMANVFMGVIKIVGFFTDLIIGVNKIVGAVASVFGKLYDKMGLFGVALGVGAGMFAKWLIGGFMKAFFGQKFGIATIKAGVVNVSGPGGAGGGGGGFGIEGPGGGGKGGRGTVAAVRAARAAKIATAAEETRRTVGAVHAVTDGGKAIKAGGLGAKMLGAGSKLGTIAGKIGAIRGLGRIGGIIGKKIPGVSIGVGVGLGAMRLAQGDVLGAGLEIGSGLAATVPVIGTAASLLVDSALMTRDIVGHNKSDALAAGALKKVAGVMTDQNEQQKKQQDTATAKPPGEDDKGLKIVLAPAIEKKPEVVPTATPANSVPDSSQVAAPTTAPAPAPATPTTPAPAVANYSPATTLDADSLASTHQMVDKLANANAAGHATTTDAAANLQLRQMDVMRGLGEAQMTLLKQIADTLRQMNNKGASPIPQPSRAKP